MINNKTIKAVAFLFSFLLLGACINILHAQVEEDQTGYDNYYTTPAAENGDSTAVEYDLGDGKDGAKKAAEKKPLERITMPFDTTTELITYVGIVEQEDSYYDSMYLRAMKYMMERFNLTNKNFKTGKADMNKINMVVTMPFEIQMNKFVKENNGELQFELKFWFKDGKYKYEIDHLRHNLPITASGSRTVDYIYLEFYLKSDKNVVNNDKLLRAANDQINQVVKEIKKALREPKMKDEDEWDF
jgi:hypothetical protein